MISLESIKTNDGKSNISLFWGFQIMNLNAFAKESGSFKGFEKLPFVKDIMTVEPKDHIVHLDEFLKFSNTQVGKLGNVFELGGGCGSLCKLIHDLGFKSDYTILDIPAISELQKCYLEADNIKEYDEKPKEVDLFISMWALSETPFGYRDRILKNISFNKCFITFQKEFGTEGIEVYDNLKYFKKLIKRYKSHNWSLREIDNLPGNYYLFGEKHA